MGYDWNDMGRVRTATLRAASEAFDAAAEELRAQEREDEKANDAARKKGKVDLDNGWTDEVSVSVTRYGTIYGRNAYVGPKDRDRDAIHYEVYQNAHTARGPVETHEWHIKKTWWTDRGINDTVLWEVSRAKDYEEAIKVAIRLSLKDQGVDL
jgi:hypothetical protein